MLKRCSSQLVPRDIQFTLDRFFSDLEASGISYVGHGVVSDEGDHTGYFSNDKWGHFYIEKQCFFDEPILDNYHKEETTLNLISWDKVKDCHSIAHLRNQQTEITSGLTICRQENGFNTFFNIGFKEGVDLVDFSFFKRDLLLAYFSIFNNYHLRWRSEKRY